MILYYIYFFLFLLFLHIFLFHKIKIRFFSKTISFLLVN